MLDIHNYSGTEKIYLFVHLVIELKKIWTRLHAIASCNQLIVISLSLAYC